MAYPIDTGTFHSFPVEDREPVLAFWEEIGLDPSVITEVQVTGTGLKVTTLISDEHGGLKRDLRGDAARETNEVSCILPPSIRSILKRMSTQAENV